MLLLPRERSSSLCGARGGLLGGNPAARADPGGGGCKEKLRGRGRAEVAGGPGPARAGGGAVEGVGGTEELDLFSVDIQCCC